MIKRIFGSTITWIFTIVIVVIIGVTFLMPPTFFTATPTDRIPAAQIPSVPGDTYQLPAHFRNVFTFCDRGHRIYVTAKENNSSSSDIAVVPNDPSCRPVPMVDEHG